MKITGDSKCKRCGDKDPYWMMGDDPALCDHCNFMLYEWPKICKKN